MNICLSMIVRNEAARIERCLASVAPHISTWAILDTGSDDDTIKIIGQFFAERRIEGILDIAPFVDFSTTRNKSLAMARSLDCDYILLADADMELVHGKQLHQALTAPAYQIIQRGSGLTYWNTRLVRRDHSCRYVGVTHEYLDTGVTPEKLHGVWFRDHMDGANRPGKTARDIALLEADVQEHPDNARSWFYLGQSLKESGQLARAADSYMKRIALGGWQEEVWRSRLEIARCFREMKNEPAFEHHAVRAYNERPWRAEPLYDLAKFYREKSMHAASVLYAEKGLRLPRPADDLLFVEDFPLDWGFKEELAICGYYSRDPADKALGYDCCEELALSREAPAYLREQAWRNLFFYTRPLRETAPSFHVKRIDFTPPDGYRPFNPSVCRLGDRMVLNVRACNYLIGNDGRYVMPSDNVVRTRNFLFLLGDDLSLMTPLPPTAGPVTGAPIELHLPLDLPPPVFNLCLGFEDVRLFPVGEQLWCSATTRQIDPEGWCEIVVSRIRDYGQMTDWRVIRPEGRRAEKNWMPIIDAGGFIYSCDPGRIIGDHRKEIPLRTPPVAAAEFGGSSQAIPFDEGYLCLIHERQAYPDPMRGQRNYQRRFVWFDADMNMRRISRRFTFGDGEGEFCCGMCWHPDGKRLVISYGVLDREAWLATVDADEVRAMLREVGDERFDAARADPDRDWRDGPPVDLPDRTEAPMIAPSEKLFEELHDLHVRAFPGAQWSLGDLFRKYGTDKGVNGYAPYYEELFGAKRDEIKAVLEIGIGTMDPTAPYSMAGYAQEGYRPGGSLRAWRDWFPNARIHGLDVQSDALFKEERISTWFCDSTNRACIEAISVFDGIAFDIIIDDGNHSLDAQLKTLANCLPLLKEGGTYVIEDIVWDDRRMSTLRMSLGARSWRLSGPRDNLLVIKDQPWLAVPDPFNSDPWLSANTNAALRSEADLQYAIDAVRHNGWPTHPDRTKNWDCYIAVRHVLKHASQNEPILDAGGDRISTFLPTLATLGYGNLVSVNLLHNDEFEHTNLNVPGGMGIKYQFGNIEDMSDIYTPDYGESSFAFIACLSTIEHGVNVPKFLKEAARILKPGGHLFVSTDFWPEPIDTRIAGWRIFTADGIDNMIFVARAAGLQLTTAFASYAVGERVCRHKGEGWGGDYTFINLLFRKSA